MNQQYRDIELHIPAAKLTGLDDRLSEQEIQILNSLTHSPRFREMLMAVLCVNPNNEIRSAKLRPNQIFDANASFEISAGERYANVCLNGIPTATALPNGKLSENVIDHIGSVIRDKLSARTAPNDFEGSILHTAKRAGVLKPFEYEEKGREVLRLAIWGGHKIPKNEQDFAKSLGFNLIGARNATVLTTGCGGGVMEGPFKGALQAHGARRTGRQIGYDVATTFRGFSSFDILAKEAPNGLTNPLVSYRTIEERIVAFIRANHGVISCSGGAGTFEESLMRLAISSEPSNNKLYHPFFIANETGSKWGERFNQFIQKFFGNDLSKFYKVVTGRADQVALEIINQMELSDVSSNPWNYGLYFSPNVIRPFTGEFSEIDGLQISQSLEASELLTRLRITFSFIVHATVKDPNLLEKWGQKPTIIFESAEQEQAFDTLLNELGAEGRIYFEDGRYKRPYSTKISS